MSEIGIKDQCFGVEVEMTGITREKAAKALADYFGTSPHHGNDYYDSWYVKDGEGKEWRLMRDGSIREEYKENSRYLSTSDPHYSVELVTPTEPEVPVAPEAPTVPEDSPRLPQTGQTMWLAGLLAAGGLLMLFVGLVERKRHHGKHEA